MAEKKYQFNNARDAEERQQMLLELLIKIFCKCCEKYLCPERSNIVCDDLQTFCKANY